MYAASHALERHQIHVFHFSMIFFEVRCSNCDYFELWGLERAIQALTAVGKLSPAAEFHAELFAELFRVHAKHVACSGCGKTETLRAVRTQKGDWDWEDAVRCEDCGGEIPEARLRAVPGATRCVKCQEEFERFR